MADIVKHLPKYDWVQQIYCISTASNAVGKQKGTTHDLETAFRVALNTTLPKLTPVNRWETAWGPAVYKSDPEDSESPPTNAWFVAQNHQEKRLVVGIAGTAQNSEAGLFGDLNVAVVVHFTDWTKEWTAENIPTPPEAILKSPDTASAPGTLLSKFLQDFQNQHSDYSIIFTGHSMGGAIAPTLALGLIQSGILQQNNVHTMFSAGASPGNDTFNKNFSSIFPPTEAYNMNQFNNHDVVPQAWCRKETEDRYIANIKNIYNEVTGDAKTEIDRLVGFMTDLSRLGTDYLGLTGQSFTGPDVPNGISDLTELATEMIRQHTVAYWKQIGIMDFAELFERQLKQVADLEPQKGYTVGDADQLQSLREGVLKRALKESQQCAQ